MDAVGRIISQKRLKDPVTNPEIGKFANAGFTELFDMLIAQGSADYVAGLQVGAYIEEIDIQYLHDALETEGVTYDLQVLAPEVYNAILNPSPVVNDNGQQ